VQVRLLLAVLACAAAAGCGGSEPTAEAVVRAWSEALNAGEIERAASYFAQGAQVVQGVRSFRIDDADEALDFARSLPCGREIVAAQPSGNRIEVTIELTRRPGRRCAGPGRRTGLIVRVEEGQIVLWHEVPARAEHNVTV
jgi:hypothetical protein